jgi:1,4-dihydroxy-2-naphthoyl-CoA hydrolase
MKILMGIDFKGKKFFMSFFIYTTKVHLRDTDATGVLYFADQFRLALEALEAFLLKANFPLKKILTEEDFLLPIVHAEADYFAPLTVDDFLEIHLQMGDTGSSSFTIHYELIDPKRNITVGKVSLVHVVLSKKSQTSMPIPESLRNSFNLLREGLKL